MKRILMATLMAVLGVGTASADFLYESEMTVSGYKGTETLSGFPVLVRLAKDSPKGFQYGLCQADGKDIAFYSSDGETVYPHEIEKWDSSGESLVWVRIPSLAGMDTKFLFRFGDASVTTAPVAKTTWADSNGGFYAGVWHFNEKITAEDITTTTAPNSADSAKHSDTLDMDAVPTKGGNGDFSMMVSVNGMIGSGRQIASENLSGNNHNKWNGNYLKVADYDAFAINSRFTASGWFFQLVGSGYQCFFSRSTARINNGWGIEQNINMVNSPYAWVNSVNTSLGNADFTLAWHHLVFVYDQGEVTCFLDGVKAMNKTGLAENIGAGLPFQIGKSDGASLHGYCDEVRLLSAPVSADWAKAEYDAVKESSFVVGGDVKSRATDMLTVTSNTEELGTVTPAYGVRTDIKGGDVVNFSAPDEVTVLSDVLKCRYDGWKLYRKNSEDVYELIDSAATNAFRYVHEAGTDVRFVWNVRRIVPISVLAEGGTVTVNGQTASTVWCDEGEATLIATPQAGSAFVRWSGDTAGIDDVTLPTVSVADPTARSLTAVFCGALGVCKYECVLTLSGYTNEMESVLTNFPVLVRLSANRPAGFDPAACGTDGQKMVFLSPDGLRAYPFEIERWNAAGESLVWVRVPRLSGRNTVIRFCYGGKLADTSPVSARDVWSTAGDAFYAGVWHMAEAVDAESGGTVVSTDSARRSSAVSMDAVPTKGGNGDFSMMVSVDGPAGVGRQIASSNVEGTNHNRWNGNSLKTASYDKLGLGGTFTVSGWFSMNRGSGYQGFFGRATARPDATGWAVDTNINSTDYLIAWAGSTSLDSSGTQFLNVWHHVTFVAEEGEMRLFVDGKRVARKVITPIVDNEQPFTIGLAGSASLHGAVDEIRMRKGAASAAWVRAECDTVANADFVTFGKVKNRWLGFSVIVR